MRTKSPPSTYIGKVRQVNPEEATKLLIRVLQECHGHPEAASRVLDISRPHIYYLIRKLGLRGVPRQIREKVRSRFRLRGIEETENPCPT